MLRNNSKNLGNHVVSPEKKKKGYNNNNDRLTAFDPGQPG